MLVDGKGFQLGYFMFLQSFVTNFEHSLPRYSLQSSQFNDRPIVMHCQLSLLKSLYFWADTMSEGMPCLNHFNFWHFVWKVLTRKNSKAPDFPKTLTMLLDFILTVVNESSKWCCLERQEFKLSRSVAFESPPNLLHQLNLLRQSSKSSCNLVSKYFSSVLLLFLSFILSSLIYL